MPNKVRYAAAILLCAVTPLLVGCLEQVQSPRLPAGALNNFLLHLQQGELDDARAYFAPGLVAPSPQLDASLVAASGRLRRYQIEKKKPESSDLEGGQKQQTVTGRVRPLPLPGQPTPGPDEGWQETDILTARMVERGPGWRILDYEVLCCEAP